LNIKRLPFLVIGALLLLSGGSAFANILLPGGMGAPATDFTTCATCALPGQAFAGMFTGVAITGFASAAGIDTPGSTIAGTFNYGYGVDADTGHLDFLYQVDLTATDLQQLTANRYFASLGVLDLGYLTDLTKIAGGGFSAPITGLKCSAAGTAPCVPLTDDWVPNKVDFSFTPVNAIQAGQSSPILVVRTLIDSAGMGNVFAQDDGQMFHSAFDPSPEPAFYGLLSLGMAGLFAVSFRRKLSKDRTL
jgi:hypothetical protein